jgi:site-specific recombinase XerD
LRALSQKQWGWVQAWLDEQAPSPALRRLRFILSYAYMSGMRLSELVASKVEWLRHEQLDDGEWAWSIMVLGKRNKWREVPLPDPAVLALQAHFADRNLDTDLLANPPGTPIIAKLNLNAPLSAARLYEVLVTAFERCALDVAARDRRAAERIREASTHWLRHTYGSHSAARGVPQDVLQANLGHESLATTSIYVRAEKGRRHHAMQAAFASQAPGPSTPGKR